MKGPAAALSSRGIQSEGDFHPAGERRELGVVNTDTRGALPGQTLPLFLLQAPIYSPPNFTPFLAVMSSVCVTSSYPSIIITGWCSPLARCPHFLTMQSCKERMQKQAGSKEQPFFAGSGEPLPPSVLGWWCHSRNTLCSVAAAVSRKQIWSQGKGRERCISSLLDSNSSLCKHLKHLDTHLHLQREGSQLLKDFLSV